MAMRTYYQLKCSCGHIGQIKLSENDQPYSENWQLYSLIDLEGGSYSGEDGGSWEIVFKKLKPTCPECKNRLKPDDFYFN